jgi:hypothetical protein
MQGKNYLHTETSYYFVFISQRADSSLNKNDINIPMHDSTKVI